MAVLTKWDHATNGLDDSEDNNAESRSQDDNDAQYFYFYAQLETSGPRMRTTHARDRVTNSHFARGSSSILLSTAAELAVLVHLLLNLRSELKSEHQCVI